MRGGTSKGVVVQRRFLPDNPQLRDRVILAIFGSPDRRQINGLGGADPLTSKIAIVSPSDREDADVDYTFGQVGIESATVNYAINCGNMSSVVGPFAIDEGLVRSTEPSTTVRIFNTNTEKLIIADVPVKDGKAQSDGDHQIEGIPGRGAEIRLTFVDPSGAVTGRLLPTGNLVDTVASGNRKNIRLSIIDSGTLYACVPAKQFGLRGTESPTEIEKRKDVVPEIQNLRELLVQLLIQKKAVDKRLGNALKTSLKIALVGKPAHHKTEDGRQLDRQGHDLVARIINPIGVHKAFAVTGAIALATSVFQDGTIPHQLGMNDRISTGRSVRIAHPCGLIEVTVVLEKRGDQQTVKSVSLSRTARRIMEGFVYVPNQVG